MDESPGPASFAALRDALLKGREPPPARSIARLASYRWFVVGTVCIGAFMGQVDSSITQLVLPRLEVDFNARLSTVSWVAVAYLLTMAGFLPVFGRLADMFGRKLLYTGGFLLFVLGSTLCGFAPNLPALIAFRVLQAIGAALLSSNSVAIVVTAAGPDERGRALGVMAAAQAVGLSAGPALGGLVLDTLGWQWVFWINVPFGLAAAVIGWFVIPPTSGLAARRALRLDGRVPDPARAHRTDRGGERGACLGCHIASLRRRRADRDRPAASLRPDGAPGRDAAHGSRAVPQRAPSRRAMRRT